MGVGDIRQRVELEMQGIGGDTVTILAQALRELQAQFKQAVGEFDNSDSSALKLIGTLKSLASGLKSVGDIATADADRIARLSAENEKFIEATNRALEKKDADEAKLDAAAQKRLDDKAARDQKALDAIGAASEKAAKVATKAADDMAAADARKEAANAKALADAEGWEAMQRRLGEMNKRTEQESRDAIDQTAAARQHATQLIADHIVKTRELVAAERESADAARDVATANQRNTAAGTWMAKVKGDLDSLIAEMHKYEQTSDAMTATELRNYTASVAGSNAKTAAVGRASDAQARASQGAARAFLEMSRGVEDFTTGGFIGILNNIPGMINGVGAAAGITAGQLAGLTAGISLLATGVYIAVQNWDKIEDFFEAGIPRPILDSTAELKRKLDEATKITTDLGKETRLSFDELGKYEKATDDIKKFNAELERRRDLEALLSGQSKTTRERAAGFKEAVAESGGASARDALDTAINQQSDEKGLIFNEYANKSTKPRELADRLMTEAAQGDVRARQEITRFLDAAYKRKPGDFASNIQKFSPEGVAKSKADEEALQEKIKRAEGEADDRLKALQDREKQDEKEEDFAQKREREGQERFMKWEAGGRDKDEIEAAKNKATNAANKAARDIPKANLAAQINRFSGGFQQDYGLPPQQAEAAAKDMARMVNEGKPLVQSADMAYGNLLRELAKLDTNLVAERAQFEQMHGVLGQATMMLAQLNGKMNRAGAFQGRLQNQRNTSQLTFPP